MSRAEEKALDRYPRENDAWGDEWQKRVGFKEGYEQAMAELQEKITQVKKNGTWEGIDVDEFMREVRGE